MIKLSYSLFAEDSFVNAFSAVFSQSFGPKEDLLMCAVAVEIHREGKKYKELVDKALRTHGRLDAKTARYTILGCDEAQVMAFLAYHENLNAETFSIPLEVPLKIKKMESHKLTPVAAAILSDLVTVEWSG